MSHNSPLHLASAVGLLALLACGDNGLPVQPDAGQDAVATVPPSLALATANSWATKAPMRTGRHGFGAAVAGNSSGQPIFYAIGGYTPAGKGQLATVEAYNFTTNTWRARAPLPIGVAHPNGVGLIGGKLYISGGVREGANDSAFPVRYLFAYDPGRNTWSRKADMPRAVGQGVTGVINGKLYVLGGRQLYRYDPATDRWRTSFPLCPHEHWTGAGAVINGKFYVAGGIGFGGTGQHDLDVYDPATNMWTTKAPMPTGRGWTAGTSLHGKLYVVGGRGTTADLAAVEAYDPVKNRWTRKASMPTAREQHGVAKAILNGQSHLLVMGGWENLTVNEVYTP